MRRRGVGLCAGRAARRPLAQLTMYPPLAKAKGSDSQPAPTLPCGAQRAVVSVTGDGGPRQCLPAEASRVAHEWRSTQRSAERYLEKVDERLAKARAVALLAIELDLRALCEAAGGKAGQGEDAVVAGLAALWATAAETKTTGQADEALRQTQGLPG